jgi:hypothetical protein
MRASYPWLVLVVALIILAVPSNGLAAGVPPITVSPERGPQGTDFTMTATGLESGQSALLYTYFLEPQGVGVGGRKIHVIDGWTVQANPAGSVTFTLDSRRYPPGEYYAELNIPGHPSVVFVVTAAPRGLPATGSGWAQETRARLLTR